MNYIKKFGKFAFLVPYLLMPFADKLFAKVPMLPFFAYPLCFIVSFICLLQANKQIHSAKNRIKTILMIAAIVIFAVIQLVVFKDFAV